MRKFFVLAALLLGLASCKGNEAKESAQKAGLEQTTKAADVSAAETTPETNASEATSATADDVMDISKLPPTAQRMESREGMTVYVNVEKAPNEDDITGLYTVWLANEERGTVQKICQTNPMAKAQWDKMNKLESNAVDVPIDQIAVADKAYLAPGGMIIVEGCPDARNTWTYLVNPMTRTAKQLPSTEGVVNVAWEDEEVIVSSYRYDTEEGRYSYTRAYTIDGQFLRVVDEHVEE